MSKASVPLVALLLVSSASPACAVRVQSVSVDVYEVFTELTVGLDEPTTFTCEAGGQPHTLVLSVAAEAPGDIGAAPAGRIESVRVARAKGAATFILKTTADVGTFRAYRQREPAAVVLDVYRRLELTLPRPEPRFKRLLGDRKILLVDDDDGPGNGNKYSVDVEAKYRAALERMGIPYDVYVVRAGRDGPPATKLYEYPFVIWFNGLDARPLVVSAADERAATAYLERGGRLWLVSQNYLSDASRGKTAFCREVLGITSYEADTQVAEVVVGPAASSLPRSAYVLSDELAVIGNWGDGFEPPADADIFFAGPADGLCYGMARRVGSGRVVFFSFALENVGYLGRISDIMEAALNELAGE